MSGMIGRGETCGNGRGDCAAAKHGQPRAEDGRVDAHPEASGEPEQGYHIAVFRPYHDQKNKETC